MNITEAKFDGSNYDPKHDRRRLTGQILRIFEATKNANWNTLEEIQYLTGDPQASISAQLRNLRKDRFGGHIVEKRYRGDKSKGLWEYKLIVCNNNEQMKLKL